MAEDLDAFRAETREWLEANCPEEMRQPVHDERDVYWGGRNAEFKNDAQKASQTHVWRLGCRSLPITLHTRFYL